MPPKNKELDRREALGVLGALGVMLVASCGDSSDEGSTTGGTSSTTGDAGSSSSSSSSDAGTSSDAATSAADAATDTDAGLACAPDASTTCHRIPTETSGPYPDTKNMIGNAAYERANIIEDRTGVPLTLVLTLTDSANACAAIAGAHVEIWHCDKDGIYSEYSNATNAGSTTTTYLRGWQTTDASGKVTFHTVYPGWYMPRATHVHVRVYSGTTLKYTTQIGFPDATNAAVYALSTYKNGRANTTTNDTDQVFGGTASDSGDGDGGGHAYQIAAVCGDTTSGFVAAIPVAISGYA